MGERDDEKSFWYRVKERVAEKAGKPKPTQKDIAKIARISQPSAHKWSEGGLPRMQRALQLALDLGVCVEWLLTGRGSKFPLDSPNFLITELNRVAVDMPEHQLMELVRYAHYIRNDGHSLPTSSAR